MNLKIYPAATERSPPAAKNNLLYSSIVNRQVNLLRKAQNHCADMLLEYISIKFNQGE